MYYKKSLAILLCLSITCNLSAQEQPGKNELGVNIGATFYQGDLAPNLVGSFKTARPALGIFYNRILTPYWSVRANLVLSGLEGDDTKNDKPAYMRKRNFNFHSPLTEISMLAVYNIFGKNLEPGLTQRLSPYVFAGAGVTFLNIKRDWSKIDPSMLHNNNNTPTTTLAGLMRDSATALPTSQFIIPFGASVRYALSPRFSLALEGTYRVTFTDYLDGFSYAANPRRKDNYYSVSIGAVYNFGSSGMGGGGWKRSGKSKVGCPSNF